MSALIEARHLKKYFKSAKGTVHAVDDVSMKIEAGRTMGVVGESGCGKSTLGRTLIHLLESTDGELLFEGKDVTHVTPAELKKLREKMQIIFQDPYSSLNPRITVKSTIQEPLKLSGKFHSKEELEKETTRLMDLQDEFGLTYMFVTHDLSVVRHISDDITVMYLGQPVETSPSKELFKHQLHPYSKALLSAIPSIDIHHKKERILLKGEITSPIDPPPGCRFAARCPHATEACKEPQKLEEIRPNHFVACCRVREVNQL